MYEQLKFQMRLQPNTEKGRHLLPWMAYRLSDYFIHLITGLRWLHQSVLYSIANSA